RELQHSRLNRRGSSILVRSNCRGSRILVRSLEPHIWWGVLGNAGRGNRVPGRVGGQLPPEQIRSRPTRLPADAIAVADEAADFEERKSIEVRPNIARLSLYLRVQGGRILVRAGDVADAREDEAERVLKVFVLELPDTVHEDVG